MKIVIIEDEELWLNILMDRNSTSHIYDENISIAICKNINDKKDNAIIWNGMIKGEYVVVTIAGRINRIEYWKLEWDGYYLTEKEIIRYEDNVENKNIIINTYFTETSPNEKIKIYDINNEIWEYEIKEIDLR